MGIGKLVVLVVALGIALSGIGTALADWADSDAGSAVQLATNVDARKHDADGFAFVDDDEGDGDKTRGDDGTGGGNNTGDGDWTRGNDGTAGGNNTVAVGSGGGGGDGDDTGGGTTG
jgi:hypothetical protein